MSKAIECPVVQKANAGCAGCNHLDTRVKDLVATLRTVEKWLSSCYGSDELRGILAMIREQTNR